MHIVNYENPPPIEELRMSKLAAGKENGRWTWEKKYSVAVTHLQTGSVRETARLCGVSAMTLENWKKMPWWQQMLQEIRNADHAELNNKLSRIIKKSLEVIEDRLENGETHYAKDGTSYKAELPVKEVTRIASELIQRKEQVNRRMQEETVVKETIQDTLQALAQEFAKWSSGKQIKQDLPLVEEVEDALYDEREEGLQEGSGEVHEPPLSR